ncbi:MAG: hypothetical protein JSS95_02030 [Acidobacteria bacterium]|nr:hypothetical protein [Acidobacteriota bacterium]
MIWPKFNEVEVTEAIMFAAPKLKALIISILLTTVTFLLVRRNKFPTGWKQKTIFGLGLFTALPAAISLWIAFSSLTSTDKPHFFVSPDRKHVADLTYEAGFLGRDFTGVTIRSSNSLHGEEAYFYFGPSSWEDTNVRWLDDQNLEIGYRPDSQRTQACKPVAAGISVHCKSH